MDNLKKAKSKETCFLPDSFSEIDLGLHQIISDFYLHISYVIFFYNCAVVMIISVLMTSFTSLIMLCHLVMMKICEV